MTPLSLFEYHCLNLIDNLKNLRLSEFHRSWYDDHWFQKALFLYNYSLITGVAGVVICCRYHRLKIIYSFRKIPMHAQNVPPNKAVQSMGFTAVVSF